MAAPIGGAGGRSGGGFEVVLTPPLDFIMRQSAAFRAELALGMASLFEMFKPVMSEIEREQWDSQGQGMWPALAPSTLEQKSALGYPADILVRTGELRDSLTDPNRAMKVSAFEATYGTDVFYAGYHQDGTDKMPQRQVIPDPLPPTLRQRLEAAMVLWIDMIAARTFGRI